jgi:hypothetical protein
MSLTQERATTGLQDEEREFYCRTLYALQAARSDVLVGGAYAFARYTGIDRHTKDLDIFVRPRGARHTLRTLEQAGHRTEVVFPHWLGKAYWRDFFIDVIFGSGNGVAPVDDEWFEHSVRDEVLGIPVKLCPSEEMIWSKAFIQERERFDGADVAHLLLSCAETLDWRRLLRRFGHHWRVLLAHLVMFGYIYPSERERIPRWVLQTLSRRVENDLSTNPQTERLCRGTLLSRQQYLVDVTDWEFTDVRELDDNPMSHDDIQSWTAGIALDGSS